MTIEDRLYKSEMKVKRLYQELGIHLDFIRNLTTTIDSGKPINRTELSDKMREHVRKYE